MLWKFISRYDYAQRWKDLTLSMMEEWLKLTGFAEIDKLTS